MFNLDEVNSLNIFDVFCGGDGRLDEPNMSSFLGFLLNPEGAHGFGRFSLALLIHPFAENMKGLPLAEYSLNDTSLIGSERFINKFTRVEVELERTVRRKSATSSSAKSSRRDIDLLVRFYDSDLRLRLVIAIENKIRASSASSDKQLADEYEFLRSEIDSECLVLNDGSTSTVPIVFIYLVPLIDSIDAGGPIGSQWRRLALPESPDGRTTDFKVRASWLPCRGDSDNNVSIVGLARTLLEMESSAEISPVSSHSSLLLRSMINYINKAFGYLSNDTTVIPSQNTIQIVSADDFWNKWRERKFDSYDSAIFVNNLLKKYFGRDDIAERLLEAGLTLSTQATKLRFTYFLPPTSLAIEAKGKNLPNRLARIRFDGRTSRSVIEIQFLRRAEYELQAFRKNLSKSAIECFDAIETWDIEGLDYTVLIMPIDFQRDLMVALINECAAEALSAVLDAHQ